MITQNKVKYNGEELTYDVNSSREMMIPIYHDVDGQLYMPLNERFVTVCEVIAVLENYKRIPCSEGFS